MNSKLELREEAIKLAVNVEGVNTENVIDVAKKLESYILGEAKLPELYDSTEQMKQMMKMIPGNNYCNKSNN